MTLRELVVAHRAAQADRWDHTAQLAWEIDNACCALINQQAGGRRVATPVNRDALNPYRSSQEGREPDRPQLKINADNFSLLKLLYATR